MTFFLFTGLLWLTALFHVWDHRWFERDLRKMLHAPMPDPATGDWRLIGGRAIDMDLRLRRAFIIRNSADILRYAGPIVIFCLWLLLFRSWGLALSYGAIVVVKWFLVTTILRRDGSYTLRLFGCAFLTAQLKKAAH